MNVLVHVGLANSRARAPASVRLPLDATFRELHRVACEAAGVPSSDYRTHYRGKVRGDDETIGDVINASTAKVALLPNPASKADARRRLEEELEETRAERGERWVRDARRAALETTVNEHDTMGDCGGVERGRARGGENAAIEASRDAIAATYETSLAFAEDVAAIERIRDDASALGAKATQQKLLFLNEQCERALLKLDAVESHGCAVVRADRKAAVGAFNELCDRISALKR
jgi:hypothetical protein